MIQTQTLIIGAGLSGLSLAQMLADKGQDFHLLEARAHPGGRILTQGTNDAYFDMGPAWFWPGQPRIASLINHFNLQVFEQFSDGELCFEDERGLVQRGRGYASMQGSYRLEGGLSALTNALSAMLPKGRLTVSNRVTTLTRHDHHITAETDTELSVEADRIVLALPPRIAANIAFAPALDAQVIASMTAIPTWMAGQAKAMAVYDRPFWREAGLSGDAMSRHGPLVEIHDASTLAEDHHALFGFIGVPPQARSDHETLREQIIAQLVRLFGPQAGAVSAVHLKDWAFDPLTSTDLDLRPLYNHPSYGLPYALENLWEERLLFAGTEVAPEFGGYLEGALEAAENALTMLKRVRV